MRFRRGSKAILSKGDDEISVDLSTLTDEFVQRVESE